MTNKIKSLFQKEDPLNSRGLLGPAGALFVAAVGGLVCVCVIKATPTGLSPYPQQNIFRF